MVSRSSTTAEIETFISDVSTTSTNIAIASSSDRRGLPELASGASIVGSSVTAPNLQADRVYSSDSGLWAARFVPSCPALPTRVSEVLGIRDLNPNFDIQSVACCRLHQSPTAA